MDKRRRATISGIVLRNGKWSVACHRCGRYREFERRDGALTALRKNHVCKSCAAKSNNSSKHVRDGFFIADINKFIKSAKRRNIEWGIDFATLIDMWNRQGGKCALSGLLLRKRPRNWSIDRIDNAIGYLPNNVQLVYIDINMMKYTHNQDYFIHLCRLVHKNFPDES